MARGQGGVTPPEGNQDMTDPADPMAIHIPDYAGRPICGATGRTSAVLLPTCRDCKERVTVGGMKPEDAFNPAHPIGRVVMGSGFGVPGFPKIPGLWKRFRGGG